MDNRRNPFRFGPPVASPDGFFGRREIIDALLGSVAQGTPCSIVGERRIGKTSLLNYLTHPYNRSEIEEVLGSKVLMVFLDLQGTRDLTPDIFWRTLLKEI